MVSENKNDLPGPQDQGGKHGGQKDMQKPMPPPERQVKTVSPTGQQSGDGKFGTSAPLEKAGGAARSGRGK